MRRVVRREHLVNVALSVKRAPTLPLVLLTDICFIVIVDFFQPETSAPDRACAAAGFGAVFRPKICEPTQGVNDGAQRLS